MFKGLPVHLQQQLQQQYQKEEWKTLLFDYWKESSYTEEVVAANELIQNALYSFGRMEEEYEIEEADRLLNQEAEQAQIRRQEEDQAARQDQQAALGLDDSLEENMMGNSG
ncbi:unknown protein [Seminavis robusta]|uniref:Uncharacterized protein n=1 Tax=Seminavis robusta TaxID=568900 RepID=A0A9N8EKN4_9STRA|nr:unknown protein [Seminavis robusta]|eukprot:Sro1085_g239560.1 n/a (111) ;mRNA; r:5285-5617